VPPMADSYVERVFSEYADELTALKTTYPEVEAGTLARYLSAYAGNLEKVSPASLTMLHRLCREWFRLGQATAAVGAHEEWRRTFLPTLDSDEVKAELDKRIMYLEVSATAGWMMIISVLDLPEGVGRGSLVS
jgi:hypothetical protein